MIDHRSYLGSLGSMGGIMGSQGWIPIGIWASGSPGWDWDSGLMESPRMTGRYHGIPGWDRWDLGRWDPDTSSVLHFFRLTLPRLTLPSSLRPSLTIFSEWVFFKKKKS